MAVPHLLVCELKTDGPAVLCNGRSSKLQKLLQKLSEVLKTPQINNLPFRYLPITLETRSLKTTGTKGN